MREREKERKAYVSLWVHFHLRHHIIELHILLTDISAVLHGFDASSQIVAFDDTTVNGGLRNERNGCSGDVSLFILSQ
jgi:hypothetical protein